jgi:hypothetical protein
MSGMARQQGIDLFDGPSWDSEEEKATARMDCSSGPVSTG